jgi:hypothetical protein
MDDEAGRESARGGEQDRGQARRDTRGPDQSPPEPLNWSSSSAKSTLKLVRVP